MRGRGRYALLLVASLMSWANAAPAQLGLEFGIERFRWREFDGGERLLQERGPRYRFGASWRQPMSADGSETLQLRGALYFGGADYDGRACTASGLCTPFRTDADYLGVSGEASIARKLGASAAEVFFGGGVDSWERDIRGRGNVVGVTEQWTVLYVLGGAGVRWTSAGTRHHARAGLKWPFYTNEYAELFDLTLEPKGRVSVFARFAIDVLEAGRPRWGVGVYYDSYRFDMSDTERLGSVLVWQPESEQDTVGLYAVLYLN